MWPPARHPARWPCRLVDDDTVEAHRAENVGRLALQHRRVKICLGEQGHCGQLALKHHAWWQFKGMVFCMAVKGCYAQLPQCFQSTS